VAIRFGEFLLDREARQLKRAAQPVDVSPKAFDLLRVLVDARPRVVPKEEIIDQIWPDVVVEEANVRNLIAEIRQALEDDDRQPRFVRTAHRVGYAFLGEAFDEALPAGRPAARLLDAERAHILNTGINLLGRELDCSVLMEATGVSRHHARITITGETAVLEDTGSKNGTWLNGQRIESAVQLKDGDLIRIGIVSLRFRSATAYDPTATIDV